VFLRGNSSDNPVYREPLESGGRRRTSTPLPFSSPGSRRRRPPATHGSSPPFYTILSVIRCTRPGRLTFRCEPFDQADRLASGPSRARPSVAETGSSEPASPPVMQKFGANDLHTWCGSSLQPFSMAPRRARLRYSSRGPWGLDPPPFGSDPGHSEHTSGYWTSHCGAKGGYVSSRPVSATGMRAAC